MGTNHPGQFRREHANSRGPCMGRNLGWHQFRNRRAFGGHRPCRVHTTNCQTQTCQLKMGSSNNGQTKRMRGAPGTPSPNSADDPLKPEAVPDEQTTTKTQPTLDNVLPPRRFRIETTHLDTDQHTPEWPGCYAKTHHRARRERTQHGRNIIRRRLIEHPAAKHTILDAQIRRESR